MRTLELMALSEDARAENKRIAREQAAIAPPLSDEAFDRLRRLLRPVPVPRPKRSDHE